VYHHPTSFNFRNQGCPSNSTLIWHCKIHGVSPIWW
jgi:hypothetical protein